MRAQGLQLRSGLFDVAAACEQLKVAVAPDLDASPAGENLRILHVTFKRAFGFSAVAHHKDLARLLVEQ